MFQAPAGNRSVFDHEVCQSEPGVSPHDLDVKIKMVYDLLVSNSFVDKPITLILGFFELISSSLDSEWLRLL